MLQEMHVSHSKLTQLHLIIKHQRSNWIFLYNKISSYWEENTDKFFFKWN